MDYALVSCKFMVVVGLEDLSADRLWHDHLPVIKGTLVLTVPNQQAVSYTEIRELRPEVLDVHAFCSHLLPGWPLGTIIKHGFYQFQVRTRILGFRKFDIR